MFIFICTRFDSELLILDFCYSIYCSNAPEVDHNIIFIKQFNSFTPCEDINFIYGSLYFVEFASVSLQMKRKYRINHQQLVILTISYFNAISN